MRYAQTAQQKKVPQLLRTKTGDLRHDTSDDIFLKIQTGKQKTRLVVGDRFFAALAIAMFRRIDIFCHTAAIFYRSVQEKYIAIAQIFL